MCSNSVSFRKREALEIRNRNNFTPPKEELLPEPLFFMFWFDTFSIIHRKELPTKRGFLKGNKAIAKKTMLENRSLPIEKSLSFIIGIL